MKTILLAFMLCLVLIGCSCGGDPDKYFKSDTGRGYTVETIDGCEYLRRNSDAAFSHKGNCSNAIHKMGR